MSAVKTRSERRAAKQRENSRKREIVRSQMAQSWTRADDPTDDEDFFVNDSWLGRGPKNSKAKRGNCRIVGRPEGISSLQAVAEGIAEYQDEVFGGRA